MLRLAAVVFGIGFIFIGVAGFLPTFMIDGLLLGYFEVDSMHNIVHLVSGVIAIMSAINIRYARTYFKLFGILYGLIAVLGFWLKGDFSFMMMHMNMADNILHVTIAIIAIYLGFFTSKRAQY